MSYEIAPLVIWPDVEAVVLAWLKANVASQPNIRTETDATFGTPSPKPSMTLPLVLIQRIPGGATDANASTEDAVVDIEYFGEDRPAMWALYREVHAWMLRLSGQRTDKGAVDEVQVSNGVGEIDYANPNVKRCIATYRISTRPALALT